MIATNGSSKYISTSECISSVTLTFIIIEYHVFLSCRHYNTSICSTESRCNLSQIKCVCFKLELHFVFVFFYFQFHNRRKIEEKKGKKEKKNHRRRVNDFAHIFVLRKFFLFPWQIFLSISGQRVTVNSK
jgi:hypothetical protein